MDRRTSWRFSGLFLLIFALISFGTVPLVSTAQDGNLLRDGGFEGSYTGRGRGDLNIPADWQLWFTESPRSEFWQNLPPVAFPHRGPDPNPHGGIMSLNINKGFATYTAAVYQQVPVNVGATLTASAWAFMRVCDIPANADKCAASGDFGAYVRIGIDPNGGTNPFDSDVVWSSNLTPHDTWAQMTVSATSTAGTVTVFLFSTQQWPGDINNVYFDDASLTAGGGTPGTSGDPASPAATPVPTAPPQVSFVVPQNAQPDGSIIHTVQVGDTIDSIAFAYQVTRQEIMELNNISDARLIYAGQRLTIREATGTGVETGGEVVQPTTAPVEVIPPEGEVVLQPPDVPPTTSGLGDINADIIADNLVHPQGISFDAEGNLWIAESGNGGLILLAEGLTGGLSGGVRRVTPGGTATLVFNVPSFGTDFNGAPLNQVYYHEGLIWLVLGSTATTARPPQSPFESAVVAISPGDYSVQSWISIYPYETSNNPAGGQIFSNPVDIAWDADEQLYILDRGANTLFTWTRFAGLATFKFWTNEPTPNALHISNTGDIYVGFAGQAGVPNSGFIEQWSATGDLLNTFTGLNDVSDILVSQSGTIYATELTSADDANTGRVVTITADGVTPVVSGLPSPSGLAEGSDGGLYISINSSGTSNVGQVIRLN